MSFGQNPVNPHWEEEPLRGYGITAGVTKQDHRTADD